MDPFGAKAAKWDENPLVQQATDLATQALRDAGVLRPGATSVLDVGCGTGLLAEKLADSVGSVVGVDTSEGMIAAFQRKAAARGDAKLRCVSVELSGAESLGGAAPADGGPAVPAQYNLVTSTMTFHHVEDVPGMLRTLHGYLKPGGTIAVFDFLREPGSERFHDPQHSHGVFHPGGFTLAEMEAHLSGAGFKNATAAVVGTLKKKAHDSAQLLDFHLFMASAVA